ncbi:protein FAR1-RELATED SEQUENCE 5-like [Apium graveolens]|uniref:protein FAR1-RELATED SEQUENCE 5-like n=1 Tax=Apium graveolens TaxID=4045 RepID=UPI003D7BEC38
MTHCCKGSDAMRDCGRNSSLMALKADCSSSSENDNYDNYTPVRRNPVARRKLFVDEDIVNLDSDDNMNNVDGDDVGGDNTDVENVDVDNDNRVQGLVWVDPRSMNAYKNFGDVVTFDSTYPKNRYCMLFIPITGVNLHYQNILFGFALVRDKTDASYKWVLRTWLEAVDNKPPRTIITDQDIALGNVIAKVMPMPQTKHTYCRWHISSKFPEKLSYLYTNYPDFKKEFNACVYKSLTPTEFESRWEQLVKKYDLEDHAWLNDMYAIRTQWIGAYTRQHFSAVMTTTSRSDSTNPFFDEYVQSSTGLKEFIENSQKALETQYMKEVKADYDTE